MSALRGPSSAAWAAVVLALALLFVLALSDSGCVNYGQRDP